MEAMSSALANLSINISLEDAGKALYLLSIPAQGANVDMVKVLGNHLRELTNNAEIRGGDFYWARGVAQVTLIFSNLKYIEKVKSYYDRAVGTRPAVARRPPVEAKKPSAGGRMPSAAGPTAARQRAGPARNKAAAAKASGRPEKPARKVGRPKKNAGAQKSASETKAQSPAEKKTSRSKKSTS
jgi:hypothetical protein